ncbi:ribonuclease H-like domain-containing protein [Tanacetum coccineum]
MNQFCEMKGILRQYSVARTHQQNGVAERRNRIQTAQRNFIPPTLDLSFIGLDELVNEPVVENNKAMSSEEEPKVVRKNDAPIIEEWVLDDEEEDLS